VRENAMSKHCIHAITSPLFFTLLLAACSPSGQPPQPPRASAPQIQQPQQAARVPNIELPSFATLVKKEGPAVVNITTTQTVKQGAQPSPGTEGDPLSDFFRRFMQPPDQQQEYQARGVGSGFIISADGYVLTNAHVVADSDEITVKLTNKREYKAKLIGADLRTDVALVKIDANNLPIVPIGDPGTLDVGEWVAAIGAPFGFENSVTAGIVSAKGRSLPGDAYVPFIQTDVAVNPGNSGGPLFNMRGEVVGINSQIYSGTGGFMGLSFAIPIDIAMDVGKQLQTNGKVTRGRIGVQAQELTVELATSFGLKEPNGALISNVEKGGPAAKAGIMPGDVILSFNGKTLENSTDLARVVAGTKPGTTAPVELWRKGASKTVQVLVAELPQEKVATQSEPKQMPANRAGLALAELTSQQLERLKTDHGLLVRNVTGPAQRAGIKPGDVVLAINDTPTSNIATFEQQLAHNKGGSVALLIKRGEDTLFLPVKVEGG
jgi:serine protease Do